MSERTEVKLGRNYSFAILLKACHLGLVRWKFASADEEQGATAHRRGVYIEILDESSTAATQLFAAIVEFTMH